jgi:hypothetical protein
MMKVVYKKIVNHQQVQHMLYLKAQLVIITQQIIRLIDTHYRIRSFKMSF